ncbi:MAG: sodium:solute symporter [Rhodothermales bacterium]
MTGFSALDYAVLAVYLAALAGMGVFFARRETTTADFFLAGRRVPWWAAGLSIFGTQLSAITFMAIPAKTYAEDWSYFFGQMAIVAIAPVVVYYYLPYFRRLDVASAYEYLERRFDRRVRWFGSASFVLFQLGRMGIVLALPAIALSTVTGIDVYVCILAMGVLATLYTALGGIEAVIWTDVVQVVVLLGGAALSLIWIAFHVDGGAAEIGRIGEAAGKWRAFDWAFDATAPTIWVVFVGNLFANLVPYTTDQTVIQRYLTTPDERQAARSIWTNAVLTVPASLTFFTMGTALFAFYQVHPASLPAGLAGDAIFPWFIAHELPPGVSGLVIAALFAAAMSSIDSSMNSVATSLVEDVYRLARPNEPDAAYLRLARRLTVGLGVLGTSAALALATFEVKSLWDVFLQLVGLFGGSLAGVFALGMFTRRADARGAWVGALASAAILFGVQRYTSLHFFLYAGVGVVSCFVIGLAASRRRSTM